MGLTSKTVYANVISCENTHVPSHKIHHAELQRPELDLALPLPPHRVYW